MTIVNLIKDVILVNKKDNFTSEVKVYLLFAKVLLLMTVAGSIMSFIIDDPIQIKLVVFGVMVLNVWLILKVQKLNKLNSTLKYFTFYLYAGAFSFIWMNTGGFSGPSPLLFVWLAVLNAFLFNKLKALFNIVVIILIMWVLLACNTYYPDSLIELDNEQDILIRDIVATLVISFAIFLSTKIFKSENNKLQLNLEKKFQSINNQNKKLSLLSVQKDQIFYSVTHDLKEPLNRATVIFNNYKENKSTNTKSKEVIAEISNELKSIANFTNNILQWAKARHQGINIVKMSFSAGLSISNAIKHCKYLLQEKNIEVKTHFIKEDWAWGDKNLFEMVVRYILTNAITYSNNNQVIDISIYKHDEKLLSVSIKDNGVGIPKEKLAEILGSGLENNGYGLKLSKIYIELNEGHLFGNSEIGKGSEFIFTIPLTLNTEINQNNN